MCLAQRSLPAAGIVPQSTVLVKFGLFGILKGIVFEGTDGWIQNATPIFNNILLTNYII